MEFLKQKGLALIVTVIALALVVFLVIQNLEIQEKTDNLTPLVSELKQKELIKPYPSVANIKILEGATMAWERQLERYQGFLPKIETTLVGTPIMSSGAFSAKRTKTEKALKNTYNQKGIFWPEECNLGFETYVSNPVPNKAINMLNYELEAITYILRLLAKNEVTGLRNIVRKPLSVEEDKPRALVNRGRNAGRNVAEDANLIENLEIELVFTGSESSIRASLNDLVNTSKYLFSIKSLSLKNSKLLPVDLSLIEFKDPAQKSLNKTRSSSFDLAALFGSSTSSNEESAQEAKVIQSREIFKQILGKEEVLVGLVLEVVLLREG